MAAHRTGDTGPPERHGAPRAQGKGRSPLQKVRPDIPTSVARTPDALLGWFLSEYQRIEGLALRLRPGSVAAAGDELVTLPSAPRTRS